MNNTSSLVVDWWIAYFMLKSERERAVYDDAKGSGGKEMSGEDAGHYLATLTGQKNVE